MECDLVEIYEVLLNKIIQQEQYQNNYKVLVKEICQGVANIVGTTDKLASIIVKDSNLCNLILQVDKQYTDASIKSEIVCLFFNALDTGSDKIKFELLRQPIIEYFIDSLLVKELNNQIMALSGLQYLLDYGKDINIEFDLKLNIVAKQIEDLNGVIILEKLRDSQNKDISALASEMLQSFFQKEESNSLNN